MKIYLIIILAIISFVSCSPFSKDNLKQADQDITLKEVLKDIDQYKESTVLWGGTIIETINRPSKTLIIVLQSDLDYEKRPIKNDKSDGRFIIKKDGFLDPEIYAKDRKITVIGQVIGKEDFPLGEIRYLYPVVKATQLILWEKPEPQPYYHDPWNWGPYPSWWYNYPYYPYYYHRRYLPKK